MLCQRMRANHHERIKNGTHCRFQSACKIWKTTQRHIFENPHHNMIEVMAQSGLDFVCLDAEHAPFDRAAIDACMAVSRALDYPVLVRVGDSSPREILWALDCGAAGIVVPHVDSVERAEEIARTARVWQRRPWICGHAALGWIWHRKNGRPFGTVTTRNRCVRPNRRRLCRAPIHQIAAIDGIDALSRASDLTVSMGHTAVTDDLIGDAMTTIGKATKAHGKGYASYIGTAEAAAAWHEKLAFTSSLWPRNTTGCAALPMQQPLQFRSYKATPCIRFRIAPFLTFDHTKPRVDMDQKGSKSGRNVQYCCGSAGRQA